MPRGRRRAAAASPASSTTRAPKVARTTTHRYNTSRAKRNALLGGEQEGRKPMIPDAEFRTRIKVISVISIGKALGVETVDKKAKVNTDAHHTSEYETKDLVVRRGAPFHLGVTFDRDINLDVDSVTLQFSYGPRPQESKETLVRLKLDIKDKTRVTAFPSLWSASVSSVKEKTVEVSVSAPVDAIIGKHQLYVETRITGDEEQSLRRYELEDWDIVILFNPWCSGDVVFMSDETSRDEYVMNDNGMIWVGSSRQHSGRPWNFGQFDNPCLDAALYLLDKAELGDAARNTPVSIVRAISALANSNDENGVLEGRWTEKYPKGSTVPWAWTGSGKILQQFMETDKPVKYGQCWVFSGIVTTLLRALGIPTRSVTNFESAHDCDASMTIDNHFDCNGDPIDEKNDSVWNFHVWNESWFRRLDLPDGYDGWQAHDATPQEVSEGVMRCGPAPLRAIKEGHVYLNYDIPFIFSEVNGDRVYWQENEEGETEVLRVSTHAVGRFISTKSVGSDLRHDLTNDYKYPEGSEEERKVVAFVNRFSHTARFRIYADKKSADDVTFKMTMPNVTVGDDVTVTLTMKNESSEKRAVSGRMSLLSSFYTGVLAKRLKGENYSVELAAGEEKTVTLTVTSDDYITEINPEASMQLYASFNVEGTKQHYVTSKAFVLNKPSLTITVPEDIKEDTDFEGSVSFTNPLTIALTNATISLEGASVVAADVVNFRKAIQPDETVTHTFTLRARRTGPRQIQAAFTSDQLSGVDGSVSFDVARDVKPMDAE